MVCPILCPWEGRVARYSSLTQAQIDESLQLDNRANGVSEPTGNSVIRWVVDGRGEKKL
jgi:hypothetical protein